MTKLEQLKSECEACQKCPLHQTRTNTVFGVGNVDSSVMFIGEAPGEQEDLQGEPFVGRAGKLLDKLCEGAGFFRHENIYIANMLKCRPPKNRDPEPAEKELCSFFLRGQIEHINPVIIVPVGRIAATFFLGTDFKISKQHGAAFYRDGRLYFPIYHPAAILRNMGLLKEAEKDMQSLKALCEQLQLK